MSNNDNLGQQLISFLQTLWQKTIELCRNLFWSSSQWLQYAEKQSSLGDIQGAFFACDQALKKDSRNYSAWCKKGYLFYQQQEYEQTLINFNQALQIEPRLYQIHHEKGRILNYLQRYDEAISAYDEAIKFKQDLDVLWIEKGDLLVIKQDIKGAFNCYQSAQKLNANNPQIQEKIDSVFGQLQLLADQFFNQGNRLFERGNFQDALVSYNQTIEHREDFVEAWYQKGNCQAKLNAEEDAIESYNQSLKLNSNFSLGWVGKGDIFASKERFQEALDCYEKALTLNSGNNKISEKIEAMLGELQKLETEGESLLQQAINLTNSQQYQEAMKIYDQALELIGKNLVSPC